MSPQLKALIRKEWRQQRKYFWVVLCVLCGLESVFLVVNPASAAALLFLTFYFAGFLGILVGSSVIDSESRSTPGTFYLSLPLSRQKKAIVKLIVGAMVLLGPLLISYLLFFLLASVMQIADVLPSRFLEDFKSLSGSFSGSIALIASMSMMLALTMYLWTTGLAVRKESFMGAGGVGLLVVFISVILLILSFGIPILAIRVNPELLSTEAGRALIDSLNNLSLLLNAGNPLVFPIVFTNFFTNLVFSSWIFVAIVAAQLSAGLLLMRRFVRYYGTDTTPAIDRILHRAAQPLVRWLWRIRLLLPRHTRLTSRLAKSPTWLLMQHQWKSQSLLLLPMLGLGLALGVSPVITNWNSHVLRLASDVDSILTPLFLLVGLPGMLLLGTTVFHRDRSLEIQSFWRALPLSPTRWLLTKLLSSLFVGIFCLIGPFLLMDVIFDVYGWPTLILTRGTLYLSAHFLLAAAIYWWIGNPLHSIVMTIGYSAILQGVITGKYPGIRIAMSLDELIVRNSPSQTAAFYLIFALLILPAIVVLFRQTRRQQLTAW
ncbi:MAG: hypothetical protein CMJ46_12960 [Planctomyces sp.]|nr:hypothetical protein [Planctomyces sp.]